MKGRIWILCILIVLSLICAVQAEGKPPRCDRCKDACQFAEDIDELELGRTVYRSKELQLEAVAVAMARGVEDPIIVYNELAKREFNEWSRKGNGRKCKDKPPAYALMAADMDECTIDEKQAREKLCETRFNYYLKHEQHHVDWCKAGKEHKERALKNKDGTQTSYDDFTSLCYDMWNDHDAAKERACYLKMVSALGREEEAAYDLALREARMALKALYLKCGMTKSADALQWEMDMEEFFEETFELLGGWL